MHPLSFYSFFIIKQCMLLKTCGFHALYVRDRFIAERVDVSDECDGQLLHRLEVFAKMKTQFPILKARFVFCSTVRILKAARRLVFGLLGIGLFST